jgi:dynein heavy chain 1
LLIIKCFRPDRLLQATALFVHAVFSTDLSSDSGFDLAAMVANEVPAATPLALISVSGKLSR